MGVDGAAGIAVAFPIASARSVKRPGAVRTNLDPSPFFLMSIDKSRATTVSGVFDRLGNRRPARSTISRTDMGTRVS